MKMLEILKKNREEILRLAQKHGAYDVRIFGSVLTSDFTPSSDIDFLVKTRPMTSAWFPVGLAEDLESILQHKADVVTEGSLHWYIRDKILKEAQPL